MFKDSSILFSTNTSLNTGTKNSLVLLSGGFIKIILIGLMPIDNRQFIQQYDSSVSP